MHYKKASTNSYDTDLRATLSFYTFSYDIAQAGTAFKIFQPQLPQCLDYKHVLLCVTDLNTKCFERFSAL